MKAAVLVSVLVLAVGTEAAAATVRRDDLSAEVSRFLSDEMGAHLGAISSLEPPPDRVHGALTTGEFSWGSFMRALGEHHQMSGATTLAGRNVAEWVGRIGLIEARGEGKTFSQLYSAMALRSFGKDLETNPVWQSLGEPERKAWRALLDPGRFYDREKRQVINLPDNYVAVAARLLALDLEMGVITDRAPLDAVLDRAAVQFNAGAVYFDDLPPVGRYDRYSNEYARSVWTAAGAAGREDVRQAIRPSLPVQMRLWWDLLGPDGYAYPWGRNLGLVSYLDTLEICGFLAANPEHRPVPLTELAAAFHAAWRSARADFDDTRHLFRVFAFGRGYYAAIGHDREWQQTVTALGKIASASQEMFAALRREGIETFADAPALAPVARFEWFRKGDRPAGVWVVRDGGLRFAVPIVAGTFSGNADYLPAPHGLPGFGVPVQQSYPALVPFLDLASGDTVLAGDAADEIEPDPDGRGVRVVWRRLVSPMPGPAQMKASTFKDVGLRSEVHFRLEQGRLVREETWSATSPVAVQRLRLAVPSRGSLHRLGDAPGSHVLDTEEGVLTVALLDSGVPLRASLFAPGDAPVGRGFRGGLPLHLVFESREPFQIRPGRPRKVRLALSSRPVAEPPSSTVPAVPTPRPRPAPRPR